MVEIKNQRKMHLNIQSRSNGGALDAFNYNARKRGEISAVPSEIQTAHALIVMICIRAFSSELLNQRLIDDRMWWRATPRRHQDTISRAAGGALFARADLSSYLLFSFIMNFLTRTCFKRVPCFIFFSPFLGFPGGFFPFFRDHIRESSSFFVNLIFLL